MIEDTIVATDKTVAYIDCKAVSCSGIRRPEELITALEKRFIETTGPPNLKIHGPVCRAESATDRSPRL